MLLIGSIGLLTLVVAVGAWLGAKYLFTDEPPPVGVHWPGLVHGAAGLLGFGALIVALRGPPPSLHALRMGVGGFGVFAATLVGGAILAGLTILTLHLRRQPIPVAVVATHGLLGVAGLTLLMTYLTMLH